MSYVRSGKDSDVYIYGTKTHITVHVAHNRGPANTVPQPLAGDGQAAWAAFINDVVPFVNKFAGKTYEFTRYSECLALMDEMRDAGVRIPQYAFGRMRKDQKKSDRYYV